MFVIYSVPIRIGYRAAVVFHYTGNVLTGIFFVVHAIVVGIGNRATFPTCKACLHGTSVFGIRHTIKIGILRRLGRRGNCLVEPDPNGSAYKLVMEAAAVGSRVKISEALAEITTDHYVTQLEPGLGTYTYVHRLVFVDGLPWIQVCILF